MAPAKVGQDPRSMGKTASSYLNPLPHRSIDKKVCNSLNVKYRDITKNKIGDFLKIKKISFAALLCY